MKKFDGQFGILSENNQTQVDFGCTDGGHLDLDTTLGELEASSADDFRAMFSVAND
jgi:hypothetical protein